MVKLFKIKTNPSVYLSQHVSGLVLTAIAKLASGNSLINTGLEKGTINQEYWFRVLTAGKNLHKAVTENAEREAYRAALSESKLKNLNTAVQAGMDLLGNINNMTHLKEDHTTLKYEIKRIVGMIESQYQKYENDIKSSRNNQNRISEIVSGIDRYWAENCKKRTGSTEVLKQKKGIQEPALVKKSSIRTKKNTMVMCSISFFQLLSR